MEIIQTHTIETLGINKIWITYLSNIESNDLKSENINNIIFKSDNDIISIIVPKNSSYLELYSNEKDNNKIDTHIFLTLPIAYTRIYKTLNMIKSKRLSLIIQDNNGIYWLIGYKSGVLIENDIVTDNKYTFIMINYNEDLYKINLETVKKINKI